MADSAKSDAPTGPKAVLDKLAELIKALSPSLDGEPEPAAKAGAAPKAADPIEDAAATLVAQARAVRDRYDSSVKWIVAAFVAVGILVFGSLPFTNAVGVSLFTGWRPTALLWGLVAAAVGIGLVIWARTRSLEPQDATLGELAATLDRARERGKPVNSLRGFFKKPIDDANFELLQILQSDEAAAHLGPTIRREHTKAELDGAADCKPQGVRQLIDEIKELDEKVFDKQAKISAADVLRTDLSSQLDALMKRIGELEDTAVPSTPGTPGSASNTAADRRVRLQKAYEQQLDAALVKIGDSAEMRGEHAEKVACRKVYFEHRDLLLTESAVAQLRGTFRMARRVLLLGGALTLLGAAVYTSNLPSDDPPVPAVPTAASTKTPGFTQLQGGQVTLAIGTAGFPAECVGQPLPAVRLSSVEPGGSDGPFVATVVASEATPRTCVGVVQVPEGKGTFTAE